MSGRYVSPLTGQSSTHDRSLARNNTAWAGSSLDRDVSGLASSLCTDLGQQASEVAGGNSVSDLAGYFPPPPMHYDAQAYPILNDTLSISPSSSALSKEAPAQQPAPENGQGALQALEQALQQLPGGCAVSATSSADWHGANTLAPSSLLPQLQANMSSAPINFTDQRGTVPANLLPPLEQEQCAPNPDQLFRAPLPDRPPGGGKTRHSRGVSHTQPRPYAAKEAFSPQSGQRRLSTSKDSPEDDASRASSWNIKGVISKVTVPKATSAGDASDVSSGGGMLTRYVCPHPHCNKNFSTSSHARRHSRIHNDSRPYDCPRDACRDSCTTYQLGRQASDGRTYRPMLPRRSSANLADCSQFASPSAREDVFVRNSAVSARRFSQGDVLDLSGQRGPAVDAFVGILLSTAPAQRRVTSDAISKPLVSPRSPHEHYLATSTSMPDLAGEMGMCREEPNLEAQSAGDDANAAGRDGRIRASEILRQRRDGAHRASEPAGMPGGLFPVARHPEEQSLASSSGGKSRLYELFAAQTTDDIDPRGSRFQLPDAPNNAKNGFPERSSAMQALWKSCNGRNSERAIEKRNSSRTDGTGDDPVSLSGTNKIDNVSRPAKYLKRSRAPRPTSCLSCGSSDTPEWRRGPGGLRTLCNACGLSFSKLAQRRRATSTSEADSVTIEELRSSLRISPPPSH